MTTTSTPTDTGATVTEGFLTASRLHTLAMTVPESDLTAMVSAYTASGEKKWLKVTLVLDGTTYANVGVRLKGNSSLRQLLGGRSGAGGQGGGVTTGSAAPQNLPWLVKLDKYVTAQLAWNHNLAFGTMNGGMGGQAQQGQGQGQQRPGAMASGMPQAGASGMPADTGTTIRTGRMGGKANALATRFTTAYSADIAAARTSLTHSLVTSGKCKASLTTWTALVTSSGLVAADKVTTESAAIAHYLG